MREGGEGKARCAGTGCVWCGVFCELVVLERAGLKYQRKMITLGMKV